MTETASLAARSAAFLAQHICCSDKRQRSDLNRRLCKEYPQVLQTMANLQNGPQDNKSFSIKRRLELANAFLKAFEQMEIKEAAKLSTPIARTVTG